MSFTGDERAQSIQVGAVLLFAVLIVAFSSYQAFVVPNQNRAVEFTHNQQVHSQLQDLRNAIVSVPGASSSTAVSVQLGTQYPTRAIARNPGPPSGALRTNGTVDESKTVTVANARASGETGDYWTGVDREFNSGSIVYRPNYNVYGNAPDTYYEHSVAYNQFREGNITLTGQTLVDGREISLVALNGTLSRTTSGTTSVDIEPVSTSTRTVRLTNTAGNQVTVTVLSRLSEQKWRADVLAEEFDSSPDSGADDRYVTAVTETGQRGAFNVIEITFEQGVDYRLRAAKAGVGTRVTSEDPAYLTNVTMDGGSIDRGDDRELVVEVRDAYNNPVSDVTVNGSVIGTNNGTLRTTRKKTDGDGRATFVYETAAANDTGTHDVDFTIGPASRLSGGVVANAPQDVSFQVAVQGTASGGGRLVSENDAEAFDANGNDVPGGFDLTVRNTKGQSVRLTDVSVTPENDTINGLSDEVSGEGARQSELAVEATDTGATRTVELPLFAGQYGYISGRGMTLSTVTARNERFYDTGSQSFDTVQMDLFGSDIELGSGDTATVTFTEFWTVGTSSATNVNVSEQTFHLTLTYETGSQRTADEFAVTVAPPNVVTAGFPRVVYYEGGTLRGLDTDGITEDYSPGTGVAAIGQPNVDFDGDGNREVPFVDSNNEVRVVDTDGNVQVLDDTQNAGTAGMGLGDWNDDGTQEVVYVRNGFLYSVDSSGSEVRLCQAGRRGNGNCKNNNNGPDAYPAGSIAGVGNLDSSGGNDIVYVNGNGQLSYIEQEGDTVSTVTSVPNTNAVSTPADFDGDGDLDVAYVDGADNLAIVDASGNQQTLTTSYDVSAGPMAALDGPGAGKAGDGTPEIVHINSNTGTLHYYDVVNSEDGEITDSDGVAPSPSTGRGVR